MKPSVISHWDYSLIPFIWVLQLVNHGSLVAWAWGVEVTGFVSVGSHGHVDPVLTLRSRSKLIKWSRLMSVLQFLLMTSVSRLSNSYLLNSCQANQLTVSIQSPSRITGPRQHLVSKPSPVDLPTFHTKCAKHPEPALIAALGDSVG